VPLTDQVQQKLRELPHKPGIYLMKDRFGTVIYVGKARDLKKRVSTYFYPSRKQSWDIKFRALTDAIHDFDVHLVKSEPEAILLEGKLIKEFHPRYNVSFRDDKRFLLLKINLNDPIPRFTLTRLKTDDGAKYFGPFANSGALRNTMALIRHKFSLRGCRPLTPNEADYRHCLYGHLKYCTAPCIGNVSRDEYTLQVLAACEFLEGQTGEFEAQLEDEMKKAATALDFEKAAQLRDALQDLRHTTEKTKEFKRLPYTLPLAIDPDRDLEELAKILNLPAAPKRIEGFDISNISGTFAVASMVSFANGRPDRSNYRRFKMKTVVGQDDFACMAETVRRRYSRLLKEGPKSVAKTQKQLTEGHEDVLEGLRDVHEEHNDIVEGPSDVRGDQKNIVEGLTDVRESLKDMPEDQNHVVEKQTNIAEERNDVSEDQGNVVERPNSASFLPDLILIDGGKGQLNAARNELAKLGLTSIPILGLAKEFEEIHLPDKPEPLRLPHETGALKLLQRVRDESHRFANTYNAKLRLKKISESILDEFPGIGENRKAALLKKFGSVQRLRLASVEEIGKVPGFGGKAAAELKTFLEARSPV
jgi:excinuclease ABC subunit C